MKKNTFNSNYKGHLWDCDLVFMLFSVILICGQAPVVQRVDNAIHRINHYPVDSLVCFPNTYLPDSDLSGG